MGPRECTRAPCAMMNPRLSTTRCLRWATALTREQITGPSRTAGASAGETGAISKSHGVRTCAVFRCAPPSPSLMMCDSPGKAIGECMLGKKAHGQFFIAFCVGGFPHRLDLDAGNVGWRPPTSCQGLNDGAYF